VAARSTGVGLRALGCHDRGFEYRRGHGYLSLVFICCAVLSRYPSSSVSILSGYGMDDRAIGVRSRAGVKDLFSNLCVQTGSEAHPASCPMGTGGPFSAAKRGRGATLTTHPHLVPRSMSRSYIFSRSRRHHGV
jgi:hypothetical protein